MQIKKSEITKFLLDEKNDGKSIIVLFDNTVEKRRNVDNIYNEIKSSVLITNFSKHKASENLLQVDNRKVYVGIEEHRHLLEVGYGEQEIFTYSE